MINWFRCLFRHGWRRRSAHNIVVHVQGSVTSQQELVDSVRAGLIEQQRRNGVRP